MRLRSWLGIVALGLSLAAQADPPGAARFQPDGDRVRDRLTGHIWQRCSVGQRWDGELGCVGLARKLWFAEARRLESADWRLPTLAELSALYDPALIALLDPIAFPDTPSTWYWATDVRGEAGAWGVSCGKGGNDSCYQGDSRAIRLIGRTANGESSPR